MLLLCHPPGNGRFITQSMLMPDSIEFSGENLYNHMKIFILTSQNFNDYPKGYKFLTIKFGKSR